MKIIENIKQYYITYIAILMMTLILFLVITKFGVISDIVYKFDSDFRTDYDSIKDAQFELCNNRVEGDTYALQFIYSDVGDILICNYEFNEEMKQSRFMLGLTGDMPTDYIEYKNFKEETLCHGFNNLLFGDVC